MACALGKLYNKDSILEYLLDKSAYGDGEDICGHIRSLKVRITCFIDFFTCLICEQDVKTLSLTPNPTPPSPDATTNHAQFICPITLKEMNGLLPFVYIATCGCVFSQAGLKNVSTTPKEEDGEQLDVCPQCAKKFSRTSDIIPLNPQPEEEERMREAMERKRLSEPPKKSKKRKNVSPPNEAPASKKAPGMNPGIAAASRAVVSSLAMEEAKRKANMSEAVKSLYSEGKPKRKETFTTMGTFTRVSVLFSIGICLC